MARSANYSYPLPITHSPSPGITTTANDLKGRKPHTSTRPAVVSHPRMIHSAAITFESLVMTEEQQRAHNRRDSRFDDAAEEPCAVAPAEEADPMETMVDFLNADKGSGQPGRHRDGRQAATRAVPSSFRAPTSPDSVRRPPTANRLRKATSPVAKIPRRVVPLQAVSANIIRGKASTKAEDVVPIPRDQGQFIKADDDPRRKDLNGRKAREAHFRPPELPVIGKKKSLLDFASNLAHKPKLGPLEGSKASTGLGKLTLRKTRLDEPAPSTTPARSVAVAEESPVDALIRESIDSSYSFLSDVDTSFGLPTEEHSLWGEQDGGVGRRMRKKKSFRAGILGKMLQGRKGEGVVKELRHEDSTATLRPAKNASAYPRRERWADAADHESEPTSPTSSVESFQPRFPDPCHESSAQQYYSHDSAPTRGGGRSKSPALPTFHFTRPSFSGSNFRADIPDVEDQVPPVPPVPSLFSKATIGDTSVEIPKDEVPRDHQTSLDESGETSLVHVEHALDGEEEYSVISGGSVLRVGKRHSGKLPWRRSVQGAFRNGPADIMWLPSVSMPDKKPSVMDLKNVSSVTGTLQAFLDTYAPSPSIVSEFVASPTDAHTPSVQIQANLSAKLDSPSPSQIMEHDSPTPMCKYIHQPNSRSLRVPSRTESSPPKVSPLRLASNPSLAKSQKGTGVPKLTGKIFDDNPFLEKVKSASQSAFVSRLKRDSAVFGPSRTLNQYLQDSSSDASSIPPDSEPSEEARLLAVSAANRPRGCSTGTQNTASSGDQDDPIRGSFDFTAEYRALNENATRQSFVDELERFGLDAGGESFRIENHLPECRVSGASGLTGSGSTVVPTEDVPRIEAKREAIKRNSYGFIENFKFGISPQLKSSTIKQPSVSLDANLTPSTSSPPKEPLPISRGAPYSAGSACLKENSGNVSNFSISTISSVGRVVETGTAGADFVNVFDREFGAMLDARDRSISSNNLGSFDISREQQLLHFRRPSHARMSSFASELSQERRFPGLKQKSSGLKLSSEVRRSPGGLSSGLATDYEKALATDNQFHPVASHVTRPQMKHSSDSLLDSTYHLSNMDSILNSLPEIDQDSVFQSGPKEAREASFAIKSILQPSEDDPPEYKASVSPLSTKTMSYGIGERLDLSKLGEGRQSSQATEEEVADIEQYLLRADFEESIDDDSFRSLSKSTGADSVRVSRKPSRNSRSRPSSFLLNNSGTLPALGTSARSENSSRLSADAHSMISLMLDAGSEKGSRWSRQMKGMSLLSQVAPEIKEEQQASESDCHVPAIVVSPCKQNFSLKPTAPLALSRWADLQRLADEELLKSKSTWQDTMKSIEAVADFNPPKTATGLRAMLRNSIDLHQPLSEISPGTQVMRRENFLAEQADKACQPPSGSPTGSRNRLSALPTRYMLADAVAASSPGGLKDGDKREQSLSLLDVFAKFAVPADTAVALPTSATTVATRSLIPRRINVKTTTRAEAASKTAFESRQRVSSTVRREKMGWARRKDVTALSPRGERPIAKRASRVGVQDADKENVTQASQKKKGSYGYKPTRKLSHKALRM